MTKENLIWLTKEIYRLTLLFPKKEPLRYKMREVSDEILADFIKLFAEVRPPQVKNGITEECPPAIEKKLADYNPPATLLPSAGTSVGPLADLEVLDSFFEVAKEQNWVKPDNILAIQKEYANLREELERFKAGNSLGEATLPLIPVAAAVTVPTETAPAEAKRINPLLHPSLSLGKLKNNFVLLYSQRDKSLFHPSLCSGNERISERQEKIMAFLKEQGRAQVWQIKQILPEVTKRTLRRDFENLLKKGVIERVGERNDTFYQLKIVQV